MMKNRLLILFLPLLLSVVPAAAKGLSAEKRKEISQMLTRILDREVAGCKTNVTQVVDAGNRLTLYASIGMSYYPFRERSVAAIYDSIRSLLPASLARRRLSLVTDKHPIEELIPQIYRSGSRGKTFTNRSDRPLVTRLSSPVKPTHGLAGRHIAMWQSHGRYFDQEENRWRWQRSRLWETCEDLYTQSYVLPYLVPMLERAGANVLLPRERDVQTEEAIADNDAGVDEGSSYVEFTGDRRWFDAGTGFAHRREVYVECQNPFAEGTTRGVQTVTDGRESRAEWSADLPASGEYAVYVSYKTVERSSEDALYTVRHLGGESRFAVNQTMGGGTWIYLGTFRFAAGQNPALVTLSNRSSKKNRVVTADAVKIGGGENHRMGLFDMILLKDNHIDFAGGIVPAIRGAKQYLRERDKNIPIECEVRTLEDIDLVFEAGGVDRIMFDNFTPAMTREAVKKVAGRCETESSGGITLSTMRDYAECGVDFISVGALTHQIKSLDMSLKACE